MMGFGDMIKTMVGTVAPLAATALGGPLAGNVARMITGKLLGDDKASDDPAVLEEAVRRATPAELIRLKEVDAELTKVQIDGRIKLASLAVDDRDSARSRQTQTGDAFPNYLAAFVTLGFFGIIGMIMYQPDSLPDHAKNLTFMLLGTLASGFIQVLGYYFGSSTSTKSQELVKDALQTKTRAS